ncbi:putative zinc finger, RING/FYVE/PHD-type containing protein [Tanacetum coccineum]
MSRIGELMTFLMQESEESVRSTRTLVELLRERTMDGDNNRLRRRKSLQERLRLKNMVCCGSTWGLGPSDIAGDVNINEVVEQIHQQIDVIDVNFTQPDTTHDPACVPPSPRMNLADALTAERQIRSNESMIITGNDMFEDPGTPLRISLMRLLEETDGHDHEKIKENDLILGKDQMCCVCMGRKKGAAFIPCGHTFCRVCSRELWLNRVQALARARDVINKQKKHIHVKRTKEIRDCFPTGHANRSATKTSTRNREE